MDDSLRPLTHSFGERRPRARRRRLALGVGVALVLVAAAGGTATLVLKGRQAEPARPAAVVEAAPAPTAVTLRAVAQQNIGLQTTPAPAQPIVRTVRATGLVGADETRLVRVRPLSRGRLIETQVELGTRVQAGQTLATYDNIEIGDLKGQLAIAQAGLAQARAEAETARAAVERARDLLAIGGIARADLERRTAEQARAVAALRTQEAEIGRVQERMRRFSGAGTRNGATPLVAPIDGIVIKIESVPGELVDVERDVFTIADLATVWVQADVAEKDLGWMQPGLAARVAVAARPGERFEGRVSYVAQMLDPRTNAARVRCTVANPDAALRINMFATVEIAAPTGRSAVVLPPAAVQYVDQKPVVFVRRDAETFDIRPVTLGLEARDWVEIEDGVMPGEPVVTTGSLILKATLVQSRLGDDD